MNSQPQMPTRSEFLAQLEKINAVAQKNDADHGSAETVAKTTALAAEVFDAGDVLNGVAISVLAAAMISPAARPALVALIHNMTSGMIDF